jgi:hypothetical protein
MMIPKVSQADEILAYLHQIDPNSGKRRGISAHDAQGLFRCDRLAARIKELRDRGNKITTDIRRDVKGKTYARYFLSTK